MDHEADDEETELAFQQGRDLLMLWIDSLEPEDFVGRDVGNYVFLQKFVKGHNKSIEYGLQIPPGKCWPMKGNCGWRRVYRRAN